MARQKKHCLKWCYLVKDKPIWFVQCLERPIMRQKCAELGRSFQILLRIPSILILSFQQFDFFKEALDCIWPSYTLRTSKRIIRTSTIARDPGKWILDNSCHPILPFSLFSPNGRLLVKIQKVCYRTSNALGLESLSACQVIAEVLTPDSFTQPNEWTLSSEIGV